MEKQNRRSGSPLLWRLQWVAFVAVVPLIAFGLFSLPRFASPSGGVTPVVEVPAEHIALGMAATVRVTSRSCSGRIIGSGVAVEYGPMDRVALLTSAHIVADSYELKVDQNVRPALSSVSMVNGAADLAAAQPVGSVTLSLSSRVPEAGEPIVVVGHPRGGATRYISTVVHTVTSGGAWGIDGRVVLYEAEVIGGYSGGPLIDRYGAVIGLSSGYEPTLGLGVAVLGADVESWLVGASWSGEESVAQVAPGCVD